MAFSSYCSHHAVNLLFIFTVVALATITVVASLFIFLRFLEDHIVVCTIQVSSYACLDLITSDIISCSSHVIPKTSGCS